MSLSLHDDGRIRLKQIQHATGKKAVVFRGSKEDFTAALNDPGYVSSRRLAESAATDAEASLSAAASTIESGKNSSRRPSVTRTARQATAQSAVASTPSTGKLSKKSKGSIGDQLSDQLELSQISKAYFSMKGQSGQSVRFITFKNDHKIYWLSTDVTDTLGVAGLVTMLERFGPECKEQIAIAEAGSTVLDEMFCLTASGLFRLVLQNPSVTAKAFLRWADGVEKRFAEHAKYEARRARRGLPAQDAGGTLPPLAKRVSHDTPEGGQGDARSKTKQLTASSRPSWNADQMMQSTDAVNVMSPVWEGAAPPPTTPRLRAVGDFRESVNPRIPGQVSQGARERAAARQKYLYEKVAKAYLEPADGPARGDTSATSHLEELLIAEGEGGELGKAIKPLMSPRPPRSPRGRATGAARLSSPGSARGLTAAGLTHGLTLGGGFQQKQKARKLKERNRVLAPDRRVRNYIQLGKLTIEEFETQANDQSRWTPVIAHPEIQSWRQRANEDKSGGVCYVKTEAMFSCTPATVFDLIWKEQTSPAGKLASHQASHQGAADRSSRQRWDSHCASCTKIDEGINAVTCIQHYLLGQVDELPMQENRDWCLLMQFVHKDDGTYVLGMRSITHPDCVAPVVHPTTKRPSIKAAGSSKKTDRTRGAKTEKKREPVPPNTVRMDVAKSGFQIVPTPGDGGQSCTVTMVMIVDMKLGEGAKRYVWEHWLRAFIELRLAATDSN